MHKPGDNLYLVPGHNVRYIGQPRYVEIEKVGRKYLYFKGCNLKACINSLDIVVDGMASPGSLYKNKEEYEDNVSANKAWRDLRMMLAQNRPIGVTSDKIMAARKALGF